ncbi:unnamed protein product [Prunus armeniaca]|uniref:Uncharacterized protein n=1 Tax=Prunus armeniaca TaxID=36596 RepID=A0A6J5UTU0_PRUAR|nr:unnamed protein product [Prunus armeniaca]CAB4310370.1 unnamed protein product [Prunus armeniaca]
MAQPNGLSNPRRSSHLVHTNADKNRTKSHLSTKTHSYKSTVSHQSPSNSQFPISKFQFRSKRFPSTGDMWHQMPIVLGPQQR